MGNCRRLDEKRLRFACDHRQLVYAIQLLSEQDEVARKLEKIRQEMGGWTNTQLTTAVQTVRRVTNGGTKVTEAVEGDH